MVSSKATRTVHLFAVVIFLLSSLLALNMVGLAGNVPTAKALCVNNSPQFEGTWKNITTTKSIVQAQLDFACGDVRYCDQYGNCSTPYTGYRLRLWGACSPTPCDWGWTQTTKYTYYGPYGTYSETRLAASYTQSFAKRSVTIRMASSTQLEVTVKTTFTDGRAPYTSIDKFYKVS